MKKFTSLGLADARVAKVGALKHMAGAAVASLGTVAVEAKRLADRGTRGSFGVGIWAVGFGAVAFCIMQTIRDALRLYIMGEVARLAVWTLAVLQKVLADGHLGRVMLVSTVRAFATGTCVYTVSTNPSTTYPRSSPWYENAASIHSGK